MTEENLEIDEPARVKLVTRNGDVVTDYEDEYDSTEDAPLSELPETQAAISNEKAAERAAAINALTELGQQEVNGMWQRLGNVAEIEARTEAFKSPEGKLDRLARDSQKSGETYEAAYARVSLANQDLAYDGVNQSRFQRERFDSYRRKRDRGQL